MKHLVRFRMSSELLSMCCRCAVFFLLWLGDGLSSVLRCLWVAPTLSLGRPYVVCASAPCCHFLLAVCHERVFLLLCKFTIIPLNCVINLLSFAVKTEN